MIRSTMATLLDPQNKSAWEMLCGVYISAGRYKEFATAQQDRLKHNDTPSNRLVLAKIYDHLSNSALASQQVLTAVQRFPNDLLMNLAAVDVLLKRTQPDALKQAGTPMAHAEALFAKMSGEDRKNNQTNMNLTRGVYLARTGKTAIAKQWIQNVLTEDAENEEAKSILAILDGAR